MNITAITVNMMIGTTAAWLASEKLHDQLEAMGPIGAGVLAELEAAHHVLVELAEQHGAAHPWIRKVVDRVTRLDEVHDDKARALYYALDSLIALAPSASERARFEELQRQLFPLGLRILRMTNLDENGATMELELALGPGLHEQLARVTVGDLTLEQMLDEWIAAGRALGHAAARRDEIMTSLERRGVAVTTIDLRAGRKRWVHAVRGLLWTLELDAKLARLRELVESALDLAVVVSQRERDRARTLQEDGLEDGELHARQALAAVIDPAAVDAAIMAAEHASGTTLAHTDAAV